MREKIKKAEWGEEEPLQCWYGRAHAVRTPRRIYGGFGRVYVSVFFCVHLYIFYILIRKVHKRGTLGSNSY